MEEIHYLIPDQLQIIQDSDYFKFGTDSVLLANFADIKPGEIVIDLGCGSGVIPLLLAYKQQPDLVYGLEIQPHLAALAVRNTKLNNLEEKIKIISGDLKEIDDYLEAESVDQVITNPPYMPVNAGKVTADRKKAIARHEIYATLEDFIAAADWVLRPGGKLNIVHRCWRLPELLKLLSEYQLVAKRLRFVQARRDRAPDTFLLTARRGVSEGLKVEPVLIVYEGDSDQYTGEVREIYGLE